MSSDTTNNIYKTSTSTTETLNLFVFFSVLIIACAVIYEWDVRNGCEKNKNRFIVLRRETPKSSFAWKSNNIINVFTVRRSPASPPFSRRSTKKPGVDRVAIIHTPTTDDVQNFVGVRIYMLAKAKILQPCAPSKRVIVYSGSVFTFGRRWADFFLCVRRVFNLSRRYGKNCARESQRGWLRQTANAAINYWLWIWRKTTRTQRGNFEQSLFCAVCLGQDVKEKWTSRAF